MMKYFLNERVVLFHPVLDEENGYLTIVRSPKNGSFHRVNQVGYWALEFLDRHPKSSLEQVVESTALKISSTSWLIEKRVKNFIAKMLNEQVILEDETE
ncbi:MAG: hypothetical protein UX52_C0030G0013 [Candidatus Amesbacteria bacterium GW2011_GWA1_46_35]|nr:MAG: hypothetical protein UX52_C0030G0013 [Candidatus Amesbacteria bacterium GW2011_GWA1_46_35]